MDGVDYYSVSLNQCNEVKFESFIIQMAFVYCSSQL